MFTRSASGKGTNERGNGSQTVFGSVSGFYWPEFALFFSRRNGPNRFS